MRALFGRKVTNLEELKDTIVYSLKSAFLHHKDKVELIKRTLVRLKEINVDASGKATGAAVADIPTEEFTDSHDKRTADGGKVKAKA